MCSSDLASFPFQWGKAVAACVMDTQATPPNRLTYLQRVGQKIDARDILLIGQENSHEFRRPHVVTKQWPHLILEQEARADLGCTGDCCVDEPMLIHRLPFWSLRYLFNVS